MKLFAPEYKIFRTLKQRTFDLALRAVDYAGDYPRVSTLRYFIYTEPQYDFAGDALEFGRIGEFFYRLRFHAAEFHPTANYRSGIDARRALEPLLNAWEVSALLQVGGAGLQFRFTSEIVDESRAGAKQRRRNPPPYPPMPPSNVRLIYDRYAKLLNGVAVNDCVRDMSDHYRAAVLSTRSSLLHGYAMVTRLSAEFRGETAAASALNISSSCLKNLRHLASMRGVGAGARKFYKDRVPEALSADEAQWVNAMLRILVYRSALVAGGMTPSPHLDVGGIGPTAW